MTWWLQPGWTETTCACCGSRIWPEGDPDWGYCYGCFTERISGYRTETEYYCRCDVCGDGEACANTNGYSVCSLECSNKAQAMEPGSIRPPAQEGGDDA